MVEEKQDDPVLKEEDQPLVTDEPPPQSPSKELQSEIDGGADDNTGVVEAAQQSQEPTEEANTTPEQEITDTPATATDHESSTAENVTQESKTDPTTTEIDPPVTEKSQEEVQDELLQESPTKEEVPSGIMQQEESIDGLPASAEYSELPTLQEEVVEMQESSEATTTITDDRTPSNQQELQEIIEEEEVLDREEILARCREALSEQEKLRTQNQHLQHKLAEYLARKKTDERTDASNKSFGDQEQRYVKSLNELETLQKSHSVQLNEYLEQEKELSDQCSEKQAVVEQAYEECKLYKLDKSCTAVYSRTGKRITKPEMEQLEAAQKKKETELIAVRLDNIKLQYKVLKCETQLKQKEELAEGLHMIDFEQLKIDNVNLNEKIEERNEDIIKLKKKITNAVQVLTHLKQKLQFVQVENCGKKEKLKQIEGVVAQKRDLLTRTKQTRDALRMNNNALRHKGGLVSHSTLLRDFEERQDQNEMLQEQLIDLQNRHSSLILACDGLRKKIEQAKLVQS